MCGFQEKEEEEAEKREREYVERMAAERLASLEGGDNLNLHIDQELINGKVPDPSASEKPWTFEKNPLRALV